MKTVKRLIRNTPFLNRALRAIGFGNWRYTKGIYETFHSAKDAIPRRKKVGFDHLEFAEFYIQSLDLVKPSDYPVFYWLRPLLPEIRSVFDFGGNLGRSYFPYRRFLKLHDELLWTICDVPAVVIAGRELARKRNLENLTFTTDLALADGSDVFVTSGTLQFVEQDLAELLRPLKNRPPHVFINRVPFSDKPTYYTVHNTGLFCCPYRISNERKFRESICGLGYELIDSWSCPESWTTVFLRPKYTVNSYSGYYFQLSSRSRPG